MTDTGRGIARRVTAARIGWDTPARCAILPTGPPAGDKADLTARGGNVSDAVVLTMSEQPDNLKNYAIVAEAIRFLRQQAGRQPDLDTLAAHVGLSAFHLQRVFSQWAGISPKRFLQYLTKEHARRCLRQSRDVLGAALASGLSGPGRLHDLMVSCEAVTPGQLGAGGEGLSIRFGFAATPLGEILAGVTPRGVCHLRFVETGARTAAEVALRREWPRASLRRDDGVVIGLGRRLFDRLAEPQPLSVLLKGTNYQVKVWEALLQVPAGAVISYGNLAVMAGHPGAHRAVGSAMAQNRIAVLIPCHRVIRESGDIGQYRWGTERKCALLLREAADAPPVSPAQSVAKPRAGRAQAGRA
jgi:AraC family transcriptional regulator of adaptative response/methylated-DNA-[protein]-cysteine methyltransferase